MAKPEIDYDKEAREAVADYAPGSRRGFGYWGDLDLGGTWAFTIARHRESDLVGISNFEVIHADLEKKFPGDVKSERLSHPVVGWVEHLAVRMLDERGKATPAARAIIDWKMALERYPVADEDDLSEREYAEAVRYIRQFRDMTKRQAERVYSWLYEHHPEELDNRDGTGAAPSDDAMDEALLALRITPGKERKQDWNPRRS